MKPSSRALIRLLKNLRSCPRPHPSLFRLISTRALCPPAISRSVSYSAKLSYSAPSDLSATALAALPLTNATSGFAESCKARQIKFLRCLRYPPECDPSKAPARSSYSSDEAAKTSARRRYTRQLAFRPSDNTSTQVPSDLRDTRSCCPPSVGLNSVLLHHLLRSLIHPRPGSAPKRSTPHPFTPQSTAAMR